MKLAVLGATGQTGLLLVSQAIEKGHHVTAVVRTPSKITLQHDNLEVKTADIYDSSALTEIFRGHDAVVSCLGFSRTSVVTGFTDVVPGFVKAMEDSDVRRFVIMTSWYTDTTTAWRGGWLVNWVVVPFLKPILVNMREMEKWLEDNHSSIQYTVVRPPQLVNGPATEQPTVVAVEDFLVENQNSRHKMARADVATFLLQQAEDDTYHNKCISIDTAI